MSSRFVRASSYRHVFADPPKSEDTYQNLNLSTTTGDHNYIKGNSKFFSVSARGGGGPVYVIPHSQTGKLPAGYPVVAGHHGAVYDTDWNPFNDNILATSSDDQTVKFWNIPDGGLTEKLTTPLQTLSGHGKPVTLLHFHPTANNVIASASKDQTLKVWDIEKAEAKVTLEGFGSLIQDFDWNYNGSLLATASKDKLLRVWDPRANKVTAETQPHEGAKCFKMCWLGSSNRFVTCGFNRQSKRQVMVWDSANLSEPLLNHELDTASGVMMPFFDEDTKMLYVAGKGDGNIRYFEMTDDKPWMFALSEYRTSVSAKGIAFLPKRACNPMKCEVARILKLTSSSTVEPLSFIVPRKSEAFQEDIFPDTRSGEPALDADAWFDGTDADPKRMSMDPAKNGGKTAASAAFNPSAPSAGAGAGGALFEGKNAQQLFNELVEARKRIEELELENSKLKA